METVLLTLGLMGGLMGLMAVGVMLGRKPLKGSCGGTGGACACAEARKSGACKKQQAQRAADELITLEP